MIADLNQISESCGLRDHRQSPTILLPHGHTGEPAVVMLNIFFFFLLLLSLRLIWYHGIGMKALFKICCSFISYE